MPNPEEKNTNYANRVMNCSPVHPLDLADTTGQTIEEVMDFFETTFGGYAAYVRQCEIPERIGKTLAILVGELDDPQ